MTRVNHCPGCNHLQALHGPAGCEHYSAAAYPGDDAQTSVRCECRLPYGRA